jgi:type IV pilus assembly protein PilY1
MKGPAFEKGKRISMINVFKQKIVRKAVAAIALMVMIPLQANDTEIFFGDAAADPNLAQPMVMLSLDWRPNLGSQFCPFDAACEEKLGTEISDQLKTNGFSSGDDITLFDALRAVFQVVLKEVKNIDIGFMINHDTTCGENGKKSINGSYFTEEDECSNGGYILRRFRDVNEPGSVQEIIDKLDAMPLPGLGEFHFYQGVELFYEFYRYLTGQGILNGHNGFTDYKSSTPEINLNEAGNLNNDGAPLSTEIAWDEEAEEKGAEGVLTGNYLSPYESPRDFSCGKVYTINVLFQVSQKENATDDPLTKSLQLGGLDLRSKPAPTFPDVIGKLYGLDHADPSIGGPGFDVKGIQNVTSYFIVDKVNNKTLEYAQAGGTGNPYSASSNPGALLETFRRLFDDIATDPSSFVAVSVPVNVQNRVQALDQLFLALFSVDEYGHNLWPGNIKKLRVDSEEVDIVDGAGVPTGETDTVITIVDSLDSLAFDAGDGLISNSALTYWTDPNGDDVVTFDPDLSEISGKDGRSVKRGGAGQQIKGVLHKSGVPESSIGLDNSGDNRKIFLEPKPGDIDPFSKTGTDVIDLDVAALKSEAYIQQLLGVRILDPAGDGVNDYIDDTALIADIEARSGETGLTAEETAEILLEWVRGLDVFDEDGDGNKTEARSWLMGDVLHSRPLTLNFGETDGSCPPNEVCNPDVRLAFGTNSGLFHFIQSTGNGATVTQSGEENWAFMPLEMLSKVTTFIKEVDVGIDREYGVDGATTSLVIDNNNDGIISRTDNDTNCATGSDNCDKTYLYVGLRRGGKSYYALDASSANDDPQLLWKVSKTVGGDFDEMGMTFSDPVVGWVRYEDVPGQNVLTQGATTANVPVPVIMVGGGYFGGVIDGEVSNANNFDYSNHQGKDCLITGASPAGATACDNSQDDEGNAIYLIHARTGELIWKVALGTTGAVSATEYHHDEFLHSIPASITPFDSNGNNIYDRIYVGDTGGNIWRVDMPEYQPLVLGASDDHREDNWKVTKLASFGGTGADDRRFFHSLSVVKASDINGPYDGVVAVSGDRAHPKSQIGVDNRVYLIKDRDVTAGSIGTKMISLPITEGALTDVTELCLNDVDESDGECSESGNLRGGWYFKLRIDDGEKGLSQPIVIGSRVLFTTYVPSSDLVENTCGPDIGQSYLYQVSLKDGSPAQFAYGELQPPGLTEEDRYIILHAGIDGGVTPISPEALLAQPKVISIGNQEPIPLFWREKGVDVLDDGN